jgi:N-hydroxyarylamine O-acetyltransferase
MTASTFTLQAYFDRIGYDDTPAADLATLRTLMRAQLRSVPFENSEVQAGRIPSLEPADIYRKIVGDGRGGYCYEVNGLFAMALEAIGFDWYFVGARPMFYPQRRPKTHMVVAVSLGDAVYLCDTGFGGYGLRAPMKVEDGNTVEEDGEQFRLQLQEGEYVLESLVSETWAVQYGFALVPQEWIEFSLANYFNATHPDTIFTQKKLAVIQTPAGRKILMDHRLKIVENGETSEMEVEYAEAAREHFGMRV